MSRVPSRAARLAHAAKHAELWNAGKKDEWVASWRTICPGEVRMFDPADVLLEFYKYPAEHWIHLRTTNPIESTFATVRLRTKVTKGPGSRAAGIAMAYKLIEAAQSRWRV